MDLPPEKEQKVQELIALLTKVQEFEIQNNG